MRSVSGVARVLVLGAVLGSAVAAACGSTSQDPANGGSQNGDDDGGSGSLIGQDRTITSLSVVPGTATVDVNAGAPATKTFVAQATFDDGTTAPVPATWRYDRPDIGTIGADGTLTVNGTLGGHGSLAATYGGQTATAEIDVILHVEKNLAGLSDADKAKFDAPDAVPSGTMLYPYDQTVFPRGLAAPELMWKDGAAGDVYLVHLTGKYLDAKVYSTFDPPSRYAIDDAIWNSGSRIANSSGSPPSMPIPSPARIPAIPRSGSRARISPRST